MLDVARTAGVSVGTVSNVLNNPAKVAPPTREKVEAAIAELGFVRNGVARSLKAGRSTTIGFVLIDLTNSFFLDMVRGAEEVADEAGMNLLLANADMNHVKEQTFLDLFEEERVAGILLTPGRSPTRRDHVRPPRASARAPERPDGRCRGLQRHHRRRARRLPRGPAPDRHRTAPAPLRRRRPARPRPSAVRGRTARGRRDQRCGRAGAAADEWVRPPDGRRVAETILARPAAERPDAVLAGADLLALGLVQALSVDGRLRIPDDIAVIGYDNNRTTWDSLIPISTLDQAGEEMGRTAASLLLEEIRGADDHVHRSVRLQPLLVPRESTAGR